MKRAVALALALSLLRAPVVFSQTAALPALTGADTSKIGVAAAVRGSVQLARSGQAGIVVQSGMPVHLGDEIKTDAKGNLQVLLLDETVFTIGPNSAMVIDKFVYDPASSSGKVEARVVKGVFRFVTGKIAHKNPEDMEVKLPNGTIGIRGTIVQGRTGDGNSLAVLMGPGKQNNAGLPPGGMLMKSEVNGKTVTTEIFKTGFGSEIEGDNSAPKPAFKVPEDTLNQMNSELSPPAQDSQDAAGEDAGMQGSASESAGQDAVEWGGTASDTAGITETISSLDKDTAKSSQDASEEAFLDFEGPTTFDQLDLLAIQMGGGVHHFKVVGGNLYDSSSVVQGTYNLLLDIDFSSRQVGGGQSRLSTSGLSAFFGTAGSPQFNLDHQAFGSGPSFAIFTYDDISESGGVCSALSCKADVTIIPFNTSGEIAPAAVAIVEVTQPNAPVKVVDGADIATRTVGASPV